MDAHSQLQQMRLDYMCARAGPQSELFRSVSASFCSGEGCRMSNCHLFRDRLSPVRIRSQVNGWEPKLNVLDEN